MNQLELVATIAERDVLRYTPAGVPIVSAILMHSGQQEEAGVARQVEFEIPAFAAGEISGRFGSAELGASYRFSGFLAKKTATAKPWCFTSLIFKPPKRH